MPRFVAVWPELTITRLQLGPDLVEVGVRTWWGFTRASLDSEIVLVDGPLVYDAADNENVTPQVEPADLERLLAEALRDRPPALRLDLERVLSGQWSAANELTIAAGAEHIRSVPRTERGQRMMTAWPAATAEASGGSPFDAPAGRS